jgi:hypothetical protein
MNNTEIQNINFGFISKDSDKINLYLLSYLVKNIENITYQNHPLGFKYHKLGNISIFEELRLHVWVSTYEKHDINLQIHDHSFDFESIVINGAINNKKYKVLKIENSDGYIYDVKFRNEKSRLINSIDNCTINQTKSENIKIGEFYFMRSDEFHESINTKDLTITLLKIIKSENKIARVFSPKKLRTLSSFERLTLSLDENIKLTHKIIEIIKNK